MTVQIYGRPGCGQCNQAKVTFHRAGIAYEYLTLDDHLEALQAQFEVLPRSLPYIVSENAMYTFTDVANLVAKLKE